MLAALPVEVRPFKDVPPFWGLVTPWEIAVVFRALVPLISWTRPRGSEYLASAIS
jgi:hypothetical protein